jgi:hypothetical protein
MIVEDNRQDQQLLSRMLKNYGHSDLQKMALMLLRSSNRLMLPMSLMM